MSQKPLTDLPAELQLPPDQQKAIREDCERVFAQVEPLQKEMAARRQNLMDLVTADKPDEAAISAQLDAIAGLQRKAQSLVIAHIVKEKGTLQPQQREAFNRMLRQRFCPKAMGGRGVLGGPMGGGCPGAGEPGAASGRSTANCP
jgi:Spy/CpxP family protein refolding chaperone